MEVNMNKFYIDKKFRLIVFLLVLLIIQLGVTLDTDPFIITHDHTNNHNYRGDYFYIEASFGDSIWSLTSEYIDYIDRPRTYDMRDTVNMIIDLNDGYDLKEGDMVTFPMNEYYKSQSI